MDIPDITELFVDDIDEDFDLSLNLPDEILEEPSDARQCIEKFFAEREMHYGGPIPKKMLHSQRYLEFLKLDISSAVNKIYDSVEVESDFDETSISNETKLIIAILDECAMMNIPKQYAGGITIAFLELCQGARIG